MTQNKDGFSSLAKVLFIGSVLGVAAAVLYTSRSVAGIRSDISGDSVRFQVRRRPTIGWLAVFILASAVRIISDVKMKKLQQ